MGVCGVEVSILFRSPIAIDLPSGTALSGIRFSLDVGPIIQKDCSGELMTRSSASYAITSALGCRHSLRTRVEATLTHWRLTWITELVPTCMGVTSEMVKAVQERGDGGLSLDWDGGKWLQLVAHGPAREYVEPPAWEELVAPFCGDVWWSRTGGGRHMVRARLLLPDVDWPDPPVHLQHTA